MRGARSGVVSAAEFDAITAHFPGAPRIEIADADHHVMVDQPLALVEALQTLLAQWPRADGRS